MDSPPPTGGGPYRFTRDPGCLVYFAVLFFPVIAGLALERLDYAATPPIAMLVFGAIVGIYIVTRHRRNISRADVRFSLGQLFILIIGANLSVACVVAYVRIPRRHGDIDPLKFVLLLTAMLIPMVTARVFAMTRARQLDADKEFDPFDVPRDQ